ncbi:MAG: hypothetical protein PSU83_06890, partial [Flavobacterium sp.]|nr:hypothetical protein [Flavobacterium sp.]
MKGKILLLLSLLFINFADSQNLLTNSGFESGGSGFGFVTNGAGYSALATPYSGTTIPGNFAVVTNSNLLNTSDFIFGGDHTTGIGKMLVIDGNTNATSPRFWKAGNTGAGITTLTIGTTYRFSYWIKSISNLGSPANIALQITGGTPPVITFGSTIAPAPALSWRQVIYTFVATATTAQIELWNTNTNAVGNDFAVDDFILTSSLVVHPEVTDAVCTTAADGSITITGFGGTPPYVNYAINGPVTQNNGTGIFTNLPPGTYSVSITDSTLPTALTATLNNIFVGPKITVPVASAICIGNTVTLNAAGSPSGYTWTASPAATAGLAPGDVNLANPTVSPTVTTTYTVSSTVGACAPITNSVTITVNPLPNVTSPSDTKIICPGNSAVFIITGTPNSTITLTNPSVTPLTSTVNIGPTGTVNFVTPVLNASVTYTLIKIKGFFTLCERNLSGITLTITVVPNGCATVKTDPATGTPPLDLTLCTTGECRTLQANFSNVPATTSYAASSIPYCPYPFIDPDPTTAPVYNVVNITGGDDFWSDVIPLPFNFCFYGQNYNQCNAGTNGLITFVPKVPGSFCPWPSTSVPVAGQNQSQSIFGVYQDTDFSIPPSAADRQVNWVLEGQYPCRKLIVNFYNMGQWASGAGPGLQTSQIVLYEVSNIIEVFVQRRVPGGPWAGSGAIGLIGASGAQSIAAPGRDTGAWQVLASEAWRFTPTGPNVPVTIDWFEGPVAAGNQIGTGPTQVVCPTTTTTYTLQATYQVCGVPQTAIAPVTLNVKTDLTGAPNNLTECTNIFDLTVNTPVILGALNPSEYDITYHTTAGANGAADGGNPIALPTAHSPGGIGTYTVYASIFLNSFNCRVVKAFNLIVNNCLLAPEPVADVTICDDVSNDGVAQFNFTAQLLEGLGTTLNPANYTMTLHSSQPDATAGTPFINPVNNVTGADGQTFYIRITDNSDPTIFGTGSFTVNINPLPNATIAGTTTICSGNNTTITFTGTPNATVNYTVDGVAAVATLNNLGTATVTTPNLTSTSVYTLVNVVNPVTTCTRPLTGSATVTVRLLPTATISGTTAVCQGTPSPVLTFTGADGVLPYTFTYTNPSGATQTISTTGANTTVTLPVSTANFGTFTYTLVSVAGSGTPVGTPICSQLQVGTATITVNPMPTATISGTTAVCQNTANPSITFTGTNGITPYTFTYTDPLGTTQTISTTGAATTATITVSTANFGTFTYTLVSVAGSGIPACSQTQTGSATITVNPMPTATISGTTAVCQNVASPLITFTGANGTTPYTFTYTNALGATQTISTTVGNSVTLPVSTANAGTFTYTLVSVAAAGTPICSQAQTGSATVTVNPLPTATISGTTAVCQNTANLVITFTGTNGNTPYTFTYTNPLGAIQTISTIGVNTTITVPVSTANQGTFTYTLISVAGAGTPVCAQPQIGAATVTVSPLPTATISGTTGVCQGTPNPLITFTGTNGITPYTFTYTDTLGATQTISTTGVNNTVTLPVSTANAGTFTYTLVSVAGAGPTVCSQAQAGAATVTVNPTPTGSIAGTTAVCQNDANPLITFTGNNGNTPYTFTYTDPLGATQTISTTGTNSAVTLSVPTAVFGTFTYTLVSVAGSGTPICSQPQTGSATITVGVAPTISTPTNYVVCDDSLNNDGFYGAFNLSTKDAEIATGNVVITYHETFDDAQLGATPIPAGLYTNIFPFDQEIFVRVYTVGAPLCYSTTSFHLIVNPIPLPNPVITDYPLCDYTNSGDGVEIFNLGTKTTEIANGQLNVTVTYYDSLVNAQGQISPLPNLYSSGSRPIWINIRNTTTGCNTTGTFNLVVNPLPLAVIPPPIFQCSNGTVLTAVFNLTVNEGTSTGGQTGRIVTYYNTLLAAQNGTPVIAAPTIYTGFDTELVYVRIQNSSTGCFSVTTQLLRVTQGPLAVTPQPLEICDPNRDGFGSFDLASALLEIQGGTIDPNVTVTFHETQVDATLGANPKSSPYTNIDPYLQPIYVRVFYTTTGCANYVTLNLIVHDNPLATVPSDYQLCDSTGAVGTETFNLTTKIPEILGGLSPTQYTVTFY